MVQLYGQDYSGTAIVTGSGELLITGSVNVGNTADLRALKIEQIQTDILGELKIIKQHMELINDTVIKEVETE